MRGANGGVESHWPVHGLVCVQWEGPWTAPGVPIRPRYRDSRWLGTRRAAARTEIFDINCPCVGGWVPLDEWQHKVVPWLLRELYPRVHGRWHQTHVVEIVQRETPCLSVEP